MNKKSGASLFKNSFRPFKRNVQLFSLFACLCVLLSACGADVRILPAVESTPGQQGIPPYSGQPYAVLNDNVPDFDASDLTTEPFETYAELDSLGRCGPALASIGQDLMPTEPRGKIGQVKPSGWQLAKYDIVDGKYLYNRCHLIGFQLTAENANRQNLITGTRYLNVQGMLPFENLTADYIKETGNHVLYRVTPLFEGDNLVADGVEMEGMSVEDEGEGVLFHVFCYNVQPGIGIDYATGESWLETDSGTSSAVDADEASAVDADEASAANVDAEPDSNADFTTDSGMESEEARYVLNTNSKVFHNPDCSGAATMSDKNRLDYTGTREELIEEGYTPCGRCKP